MVKLLWAYSSHEDCDQSKRVSIRNAPSESEPCLLVRDYDRIVPKPSATASMQLQLEKDRYDHTAFDPLLSVEGADGRFGHCASPSFKLSGEVSMKWTMEAIVV